MNTAKAIVFTAPCAVEIQSFTPVGMRVDEIFVRTEFSGVSQGTEIWALTGKRNELEFPTIPGYQSVGVVEAAGGESGFNVGQRVLFSMSRLPEQYPPTWMGTHVSHAIVGTTDDRAPLVVPEGCDLVAASLAALPAVSLRGIEMLNIGIGDLVVVTGQGLIGQSSAQLAKLRGATVIATDVGEQRLQLSAQNSADLVVNVAEADLEEAVRAIKPAGADVVIETTGRSQQFDSCIDVLRPLGQLLLQGWYPNPITFDFDRTHQKRPHIAITCGYDREGLAACLELLGRDKLQLRPLATHVVPFTDAPAIYQKLLASDPTVLGVVFDWNQL